MSSEDFQKLDDRVKQSPRNGRGGRLYQKSVLLDDHQVDITLYDGGGLKLICYGEVRQKKSFEVANARKYMQSIEGLILRTVIEFCQLELKIKGPLWIYFYPIWYIKKTKPDYRYLQEIEAHKKEIDDITQIEIKYPIDVTTPEIPAETLPMSYQIFDEKVNREALYRISRGLTLIVGASEERVNWFARLLPLNVEPRPFYSFGKHIPEVAYKEKLKIYRISLVSGKGWIDGMRSLSENLERQKIISHFVEAQRDIKLDVLLALSGVFVGLSWEFLLARPGDIFLIFLTFSFLFCTCCLGLIRLLKNRYPKSSRFIEKPIEPIFYISLAILIIKIALSFLV